MLGMDVVVVCAVVVFVVVIDNHGLGQETPRCIS